MRKIKCIITDDEPIARKGLRSYVEKIDFLTLVDECENALELNQSLKTQEVDLIFLDIEMPYLSGLDFLITLQNPPKVILTTAYEQYALKGYELDVVDYLLKPIPFERFFKAVNKVHALYDKENQPNNYIFVKSDNQHKKIIFDDILFIKSMENYIIIQTLTTKEVVRSTLKNIQNALPSTIFIQVHRSYIVNVNRVQSIDGNLLVLETHKIPMGRDQREDVLRIILNS